MLVETLLLSLLACGGGPDTASPSGSDDTGPAPGPPEDLSACFFDPDCPYVLAVAHRGSTQHAPENTLAAFDYAASVDAHGVELDVRTTADGVLVLMHDSTVDRTTDGTGEVSELSWDEIQALTVPSEYGGVPDQRVPSFLEALEHLRELGLVVDVDVKDASAEALAADIRAAGMEGRVYLLTKGVDKAAAYREAAPEIAIMPNLDEPAELDDYLPYAPELAEFDYLDLEEGSARAREAGVRASADALGYEAGQAAVGGLEDFYLGMVEAGAQVIQTDLPEYLVPVLDELNQERAATADWP